MPSIIVPVDFTDSSDNAARYAADMAAAIGAELHLVHVLQVPPIPREVPIPDYALDELRDNGFNSLKTLAEELTQRTGGKVSIATDLETGLPKTRVKDFCEWKKPFLVVVAPSHTGQPLIEQSPFPMLTIPASIQYHPVHSILLACDQEDINLGMPIPVAYLRQLRDLFKAHFDILHVATKGEEAAILAISEWEEALQQPYPELHFVKADNVDEGIRDYLRHHTADWLVVFPKKSGFFHLHKSLSQNIILHCPVPVMSVHEK